MPELESRVGAKTVEEVLSEFDGRKGDFEKLNTATKQLIETILEVEKIPFQSVQARVKGREKLKKKYGSPKKDYVCLTDIPDVIGFRIIIYYSDIIDQVVRIIEREFAECGLREDKRIGEVDSFGYSALHMDCTYSSERLKNPEYKRFAGMRFEIQITTVIGHAWAEMNHPWYDEPDPPAEERRIFHRLAAVLELAEKEFLDVRKQKENRERVASVRVAAEAPEVPITQESLNAFIEENDDNIADLDARVAALLFGGAALQRNPNLGPLALVVSGAGITTVQQLEDRLRVGRDALLEFVKQTVPIWNASRVSSSRSYGRGISILHFVYLLAGAVGEQRLREAYQRAGLEFSQGFDIEAYLRIAKDIADVFGLA